MEAENRTQEITLAIYRNRIRKLRSDMASDRTILAKLGYGMNSNEEEEDSPWAKLKRRRRNIEQSIEMREMKTRAEAYSALTAQVTVVEGSPPAEKGSHWARLRHRKNSIAELRRSSIARPDTHSSRGPRGLPDTSSITAGTNGKLFEKLPLIRKNSQGDQEDDEENRIPPALAPRLIDIVNRLHQSKVKQAAHLKVRKDEYTKKAAPVSSLEYGKHRKEMAHYDDFTTVKDCSYIRVPDRLKSKQELDIADIFNV